MNPVFDRARTLGEAIQQSEEYQTMRRAEDASMRDAVAATLMGDFATHKGAVEAVLSAENPDPRVIAEHSHEMERIQTELSAMPVIQEMTAARAAFTDMMNQVNQVLRFMVTGDMEDTTSSGCGGSGCSGCSGCGHDH